MNLIVYVNGSKSEPDKIVQVDNTVTTFTIDIRSMNYIGPDIIKRLIEQKFEVVDIKMTDKTHVVR